MRAIEFPGCNVKIAKIQPEYTTLPALVAGNGEVTICFELDEAEIEQVKETGKIWLSFLTFGKPFQPIWGSCLKPESIIEPTDKDCINAIKNQLIEHGFEEEE